MDVLKEGQLGGTVMTIIITIDASLIAVAAIILITIGYLRQSPPPGTDLNRRPAK
jgi:hypothetical protein